MRHGLILSEPYMSKILSTLACNLDENVLLASLPLFEEEKVEAIEWSFDTLYNRRNIPEWFVQLLEIYSKEKRLIGHGVYFSLFLARWTEQQQQWLDHLEKLSRHFHFDHITEHFGFMTGEDFHKGAPISVAFTKSALGIGRDRLKRISNSCHCPVGIENLAFAYSIDDVKYHGEFLQALVEPVNGFIILDLHNMYCQVKNFEISFEEILEMYPLDKVREIHISGGSWDTSDIIPSKQIRRDTHDDAVPEEVFEFLKISLAKCSNVKYVVMEQLGNGLVTEESKVVFQHDFLKMDQLVQNANKQHRARPSNDFMPQHNFELGDPVEDHTLYAQQMKLSEILESSPDYNTAIDLLHKSSLANTSWNIEKWESPMIETAVKIAKKWKEGFALK